MSKTTPESFFKRWFFAKKLSESCDSLERIAVALERAVELIEEVQEADKKSAKELEARIKKEKAEARERKLRDRHPNIRRETHRKLDARRYKEFMKEQK